MLREVVVRQTKRLLHGDIVLVHVATKIGRVIRVDGDEQALIHHRPQGMAVDVVDHPQAHVRQRTDGERHPLTGEALDERGVVESDARYGRT